MKKYLHILFVFLLIFSLSACGDPVKKDLESLDKLMTDVVEKDMNRIMALQKKANALGDSKEEALKVMNEAVEIIDGLHKKISELKPTTDDVKSIHKDFVDGLSEISKGYHGLVDAVKVSDIKKMTEAQKLLIDGQRRVNVGVAKFNKLAKEKGYEIKS